MNDEVIKAMNKKHKKANAFTRIKRWWHNNGYKVRRVIFFPIWLGILLNNHIQKKLNAREEWNDERTKTILDYYIPRTSTWNEEEKSFYFFDNGYGWSMGYSKKYLNRKDRRYWKKYAGIWGGDIRNYLMEHFELDGFTKELGNCCDSWTEISFRLNEENA